LGGGKSGTASNTVKEKIPLDDMLKGIGNGKLALSKALE